MQHSSLEPYESPSILGEWWLNSLLSLVFCFVGLRVWGGGEGAWVVLCLVCFGSSLLCCVPFFVPVFFLFCFRYYCLLYIILFSVFLQFVVAPHFFRLFFSILFFVCFLSRVLRYLVSCCGVLSLYLVCVQVIGDREGDIILVMLGLCMLLRHFIDCTA